MNKIFNKIISIIFNILKIKDKKLQESIIQFIKFGMVGFSNVIVSYIINICTLLLLKKYNLIYDFVIGNISSFLLSVLWSFYWNNKYVFKNDSNGKKDMLKKLLKTYVAYSFSCIVLNNVLSLLWIEIFKVSKYIAPIINLIVTIPINFILNKLWAFKK